MSDDTFFKCRMTGHQCNIPYKKKDKRCQRCLNQIKEGIIDGKSQDSQKVGKNSN